MSSASTRPVTDPLAEVAPPQTAVPPDRVAYHLGAMLSADDFQAEQTYHRGRLARALAYLHGWGTAAGLRVDVRPNPVPAPGPGEEPAEQRVYVEPGVAVDRLGRLIELPTLHCIRLNRWLAARPPDRLAAAFDPADDVFTIDVFIRFQPCERGLTPTFATGPFDALDAVRASRLRDGFRLSLVLRDRGQVPQPESPWPDLSGGADDDARRDLLHDWLLGAWRETSEARDHHGRLRPLQEHAATQDPTDLLLARLRVPATAGPPPQHDPARAVEIDNRIRPFVYTAGALARWTAL